MICGRDCKGETIWLPLSSFPCAYSQYIALCNSIAMWNPFQAWGSIGDYMLCLFLGMAIIQHGSMEEKVSVPIEWLIVCGFCLYITAAYPAQGISVQGQQVFLRTSRGKWWLSKCIWCIASCTLYFACEMIAIIGTAILTPVTFGLNNTPEITAFLFSEVLCGETISLTPASVTYTLCSFRLWRLRPYVCCKHS